jgi:hypothetical protein
MSAAPHRAKDDQSFMIGAETGPLRRFRQAAKRSRFGTWR